MLVKINGVKEKTKIKDKTLNPVWDQDLTFKKVAKGNHEVFFEVFDYDSLSKKYA